MKTYISSYKIIFSKVKESEYNAFLKEIEDKTVFPLNQIMYKFVIIQTEKSIYLIILNQHSVSDKVTIAAMLNTLNKAYMSDNIVTQGSIQTTWLSFIPYQN